MKNLLLGTLTLVTCFAVSGLNAQSLVISELDSIVYGDPTANVITAHATVTNTGNSPIDVFLFGEHDAGAPATANYYYCWFVCYSPIPVADVYSWPNSHILTLDAGASNTSSFAAYYEPEGLAAVATFDYCFYDVNNPSDETCVQITFDTQNVGIEELEEGTSGISEAYPNPAKSVAKINYSIAADSKDAKLVVYSMLGSKVREVALTEERGTLKLDVSSLPSGMYFYSLLVEDKAISTKKMLVTK